MLRLERWTEPLAESNCYLLGEGGGAVVIDPNDPRGPLERLEALGGKAELILLTHEHCDHMAGLEALRDRYPQARVVTNAACSEGLGDTRRNMTRMMEVYLTFRGKPGVTYPPGHTPGSAGIFLDEDTFFSGDYLIHGEAVILRLPGGSEADYRRAAEPFLHQLPPGLRICPGHGAPYILTGREG